MKFKRPIYKYGSFWVILIVLMVITVFISKIIGIGVHTVYSTWPSFNIEKGVYEVTKITYFGIYRRAFAGGFLGGGDYTTEWIVISETKEIESRDCEITLLRDVRERSANNPEGIIEGGYRIVNCHKIINGKDLLVSYSGGPYDADQLKKYGYELPTEKNSTIKLIRKK